VNQKTASVVVILMNAKQKPAGLMLRVRER
jgi:hypothetical protein